MSETTDQRPRIELERLPPGYRRERAQAAALIVVICAVVFALAGWWLR